MARRDLPSGTVTFLFTDVEGSTKLLHALGADAYAAALAEHRRILRDAFSRHGGVEVDTQGDAFFVAFPTAPGALNAAREATEALSGGPIRVRIGLHTGTPLLGEEGYIGEDVHKGARIAAAGHGGQVLVSAATAALVDATRLRDLGLHRLKDLSVPERIYQADPEEHPPLKSLHQTNLPVPATTFLGREEEVREVAQLLARDDVRLVTLTGAGGSGKTRLALQAVAEAADAFPAGVWWVALAPLRDPALVMESAAQALGAADDLAEHVGDKRLLVLFDNFEHLMPAANDLGSLLARCVNLKLVVTSREPLRIEGEVEYVVDPLRRDDAIELFLTRAMAAKRDFVANGEVAAICERLDHLPLAIELAAARVKILPPAALLERLERRLPLLAGGRRDAPERQRTLRATIEWSHELLSADEQRLFARMAVFRGGCTLEAAEDVADADLDTLQSLVDKNLLRMRETGRFWMLETIREFAAERLEASGDADAVRRRHAEWFLALAEAAEPEVHQDDLSALERLDADHDNLRAALDRLDALRDGDGYLRLAGALWRFWYLRSHLLEGRRRLAVAVAHEGEATPARAKVLHGASAMALNLTEFRAARQYAERALEMEEALGNDWGIAYATMMIGNTLAEGAEADRDLPGALARYTEAARRFRQIGDRHYELISRSNSAWITGDLGDREAERRLHEENLAVAREIGNTGIEAEVLGQLSMMLRDDGDLERAAEMAAEAVRVDHRRRMDLNTATQIGRLASIIVLLGAPRRAAALVAASEALTSGLGSDTPWWARERNAVTLEDARAELGADEVAAAVAEGRALTLDEAVRLALEPPGNLGLQ